ncbi:transcription factor Spi-C [Pleurodeles waltl]|uniref:transcription factor Spi-C n=1 Tax=Pleurodeles waltl TaxID=8319 RepID=UPI003709A076
MGNDTVLDTGHYEFHGYMMASLNIGMFDIKHLVLLLARPAACAWRCGPDQQEKGRKKLRLFEYLHESLHDPCMCHCIQWVDQRNGVFQFISKNKETLAELWGKRKGNRKTMTYQKMARALRNYSRTGEIMKIRKKLTYQFSATVLQRLSPACHLGKEAVCCQYLKMDSEYCTTDSWSADYNYMCDSEY